MLKRTTSTLLAMLMLAMMTTTVVAGSGQGVPDDTTTTGETPSVFDEDVTINANLTVNGDGEFTGNVTAADLRVNGPSNLFGTLSVFGSGNTHFDLGDNHDNYLSFGENGATIIRSWDGSGHRNIVTVNDGGLLINGDVDLANTPYAKKYVRIGDPVGGNSNTYAPISIFGSAQDGWNSTFMGIDSPDGVLHIYPMSGLHGKFDKLAVTFNTTGTGVLYVAGNGSFTGTVTTGSSRELKKNINRLSGEKAVEALMSLVPVEYNYKTNSEELELGFIAEDVPDLVARNDRKSLSPMDFATLSVTVIQEQQKELQELRALVEELLKDRN